MRTWLPYIMISGPSLKDLGSFMFEVTQKRSSDLEGENELMDRKARLYGGLGGWRLMSLLSLWSEH